MITTKTYNSEDEMDNYYLKLENQAQGMLFVLTTIDGRLRNIVKYGEDGDEGDWADKLRTLLRDVCFDNEVNIDLDI